MYYIYMLRCKDNSIYTGITTDISRRMKEHFNKEKRCAKYTLTHSAKKLEAFWVAENKSLASKLEFNIKKLKKQEKENLIKNKEIGKYLAPSTNRAEPVQGSKRSKTNGFPHPASDVHKWLDWVLK